MHVLKLKQGDKVIKWGLWAQREFAKRKGMANALDFFSLFASTEDPNAEDVVAEKARAEKETAGRMMDLIPELFLMGAEYAAIKKGIEFKDTIIDACEWVDELGGISDNSPCLAAFHYIMAGYQLDLSEQNSFANSDIEKKTES
jgi:hypothetical protein